MTGSRCPENGSDITPGVSLRVVYLDETDVYIDRLREKQTALHGAGGLTQAVEGLNQTKTDLPRARKNATST